MAKFCSNCGNEINEKADICINCGIEINKSKNKKTNDNHINCPACNSNNVMIQMINEGRLVTKHHGILWWLFISWWWLPIKWLIFTLPALIFKIFGIGKRKKIKNKTYKIVVCQECGNSWKIK